MKNLILLNLCLLVVGAMGCGKKVQDPGPQFTLMANDLKATEDGAPDFVIVRDDENSGPKYNIEASDIASIEFIDKALICGPVTVVAKRTLKSDSDFLSFKISEAEFHGLNQLPLRPSSCILQVIATNGAGSTVTKNTPAPLIFDKNPTLNISRMIIMRGTIPVKNQTELDSYEISNPLPYDVNFVFYPHRSATVVGLYPANVPGGSVGTYTFTHLSAKIVCSNVEIQPSNTELTGDSNIGYHFKVARGASVKITSWGEITTDWPGHGPLASYVITQVEEPRVSLMQTADFQTTLDSNAKEPFIQSQNRFPDISRQLENIEPDYLKKLTFPN